MNGTTRSGWSAWSFSILLHLLVVALIAGTWFWQRDSVPREQALAIEATVVTGIPGRMAPPVEEPAPAPPEPLPPEPEPESVVDQEQEAAALAARQAEAARAAEAERVAEQRRVAEARVAAQRKADQLAREKAERERKERERVEREQAQRERIEQERRQREQLLAEQARLQRESELNAQIAAEERANAARTGAAAAQYKSRIAAAIIRNWRRPPGATVGTQCEVRVTQTPTGVVASVQVVRCNRDEIVRQSIEDAVFRASPLPLPPDPALFERNLTLNFRPEN